VSEEETKVDETANFKTVTTDVPEVKDESQGEEEVTESATETKSEVDGEAKAEEAKPTETEDADGNDDAAKTEKKAKPKKPFQKRIGELTREREDARREVEAKERENAELRKQLEAKSEKAKEPVEDDFDTYDDYLAALDTFEKGQPETKAKEPSDKKSNDDKSKETGLSDSQKTAMAIVKEAVDSAEDKPEDFDKVALAEDVHVTGEMLEALAECDNPHKVMYALGQDKDLSAQIAGKTPVQQMREIAKLDLAQADAKPKKPVKTTKAPDPIEPVGGSNVQEKPIEEMSYKEYEATRNKQERERSHTW